MTDAVLTTNPVRIRPARTADVWAIRSFIDLYADDRILLSKATVTLFEDVPEFVVAEDGDGKIVGCAAVHVLWEDLAEVRTVAVDPSVRGLGVGRLLLDEAIRRGRALGVSRLFCLTFAVSFFAEAGFEPLGEDQVVEPSVYAELLQSYDEGVAEFLDLDRVKPNTLGNTRMMLRLDAAAGPSLGERGESPRF
jgi:amino-acid N-acetyltransferase